MRLLLDESVPATFRRFLAEHDEVETVGRMGWCGTKNGRLLALAAEKFDALITRDRNMQFQQNRANLPLAVVNLLAPSNDVQFLLPLLPRLNAALRRPLERRFVLIGSGDP